MEEFELKDEQREENVKTTLTETDLELDDAEKKPLMQATREKVEAISDIVKEGAAKAVQFVKEHKKGDCRRDGRCHWGWRLCCQQLA